jgi:hypothetical protein
VPKRDLVFRAPIDILEDAARQPLLCLQTKVFNIVRAKVAVAHAAS